MAFFTTTRDDFRREVGPIVRQYFKDKGLLQKDVAKELGMSPPLLNRYLSGKACFGEKVASKLFRRYDLSYDFLLTGKGHLLKEDYKKEDEEIESNDSFLRSSLNFLCREYGEENVMITLLSEWVRESNSYTVIPYKNDNIFIARTFDLKMLNRITKHWKKVTI